MPSSIPRLGYTVFILCIGLEEVGCGVLDTQNVYLFQSARVWLHLKYKYPSTNEEGLSILCTLNQVFY